MFGLHYIPIPNMEVLLKCIAFYLNIFILHISNTIR